MSLNLMIKSGIYNHAKAVSYSAVPLMLLFVYVIDTYLGGFPEIREAFSTLISFTHLNFINQVARQNGIQAAFQIPAWLSIAVILWTSRGLSKSVQGAFSVIYADSTHGKTSVLMPLLIVPFGFLIIVIAMFGDYVRDHINYSTLATPFWADLLQFFLSSLALIMLLLGIWAIVSLFYYFVPRKKPPVSTAMIGSLLFIFSALLLFTLLGRVMKMDLYSGLYGILGEFIYVLIWVYLGSLLFFFWAQFLHVHGRIDLFALEKIFMQSAAEHRVQSRIEHFLFRRSERIFDKYGQHFHHGETIFRQNDGSDAVFFIYSGSVVFYQRHQDSEVPIGILHEGEIFGEMAHMLKEARIATAIAESECFLFVLTPQMYQEMLRGSLSFSAKIIESLCQRVFRMNSADHPVDRSKQIMQLTQSEGKAEGG